MSSHRRKTNQVATLHQTAPSNIQPRLDHGPHHSSGSMTFMRKSPAGSHHWRNDPAMRRKRVMALAEMLPMTGLETVSHSPWSRGGAGGGGRGSGSGSGSGSSPSSQSFHMKRCPPSAAGPSAVCTSAMIMGSASSGSILVHQSEASAAAGTPRRPQVSLGRRLPSAEHISPASSLPPPRLQSLPEVGKALTRQEIPVETLD